MHPVFKALIAGAIVAIIVVVIQSQSLSSAAVGWQKLGAAESQQDPVEALEAVRDQVRGTPAEPWLDYQLALQLYDKGGNDALERAKQIADDTLSRFPDHAVAPWMRKISAAAESLRTTVAKG